jgi:hypothetical protein
MKKYKISIQYGDFESGMMVGEIFEARDWFHVFEVIHHNLISGWRPAGQDLGDPPTTIEIFEFEGDVYKSLSAVAKAITGQHCNGYYFFRLGKEKTR